MEHPLPLLAVIAAAFATLSALVFVSTAFLLTAALGIGAGVFLLLRRDLIGWVSGGTALVLSLMTALGSIGSIGTEGGSLSLGIPLDWVAAIAVLICLAIIGASLWAHWDDLMPGVPIPAAGILAVAALLALALHGQLGNQVDWEGYAVSLLAIGGAVPSMLLMRS